MKLEKIREITHQLKQSLTSFLPFPEKKWILAIAVLSSLFLFLNCPDDEQSSHQCPDASIYVQCDEALSACGEQLQSCHDDNIRMHERASQAVRDLEEKNELLDRKEEQNRRDLQNNRNRKKSEERRIETAEPRELSNVLSTKYN